MKDLPTRIVLYPDPVLRRKCEAVTVFDARLAALAERMVQMMHEGKGVGLAGPQAGEPIRIFVANPSGEPNDDRVYVNPVLEDLVGSEEAEEGCLSIPDVRGVIRRARTCRIKALDVNGEPFEDQAEDLLARIWQHETDHLDGRLILDLMRPADKIANKRQVAYLEADYKKRR